MLAMLVVKESFRFVRKAIDHTPYMLDMQYEEKLLELRLTKLQERVGHAILNDEMEMMKLAFEKHTGTCWEDTIDYMKFKRSANKEMVQ